MKGKESSKATTKRQNELPGTELVVMAEKHEGLLERVLKSGPGPSAADAKADLAALQGILAGLSQKTVIVIFAMGKVLSKVKETLDYGDFLNWIEENCPFARRSASRYIAVYYRYKDEPLRALAELSITEAYVELGVKWLTKHEPEEPIKQKGEFDDPELPKASDFKRIFSQGTMTGIALKRHRIIPYRDGQLYVINPKTGPTLVCNLYVDMSNPEIEYQSAVHKAHHNIQMALEVFFETVESLEDKGIVRSPFDSSRIAMVERMRKVSPESGADESESGRRNRKS